MRWCRARSKRSNRPPRPTRSATARSSSSQSRKHCASAPASAAATRSDIISLSPALRDRERLRLVGLVRVWRGLAGLECERDAIHAVAQPGRLGPVLEDMPEMPAAASAMHLGAAHEKAAVGLGLDPVFEGRPEARPSRAAVEFGSGVEQRLAAGGAVIDPGAVLLVERARPGALGAVLAQDPVLLGVQRATPFLVAVLDLEMLVRFR